MTIKNISKMLLATSIVSGIGFTPALINAATLSQHCELGKVCPIPGNDGGVTKFDITPQTGMNYFCEVKANEGSLKFLVTGGKAYSLSKGGGFYNANPEVTMEIRGHFKHPDKQTELGGIYFRRLPLSGEGTVTCSAKN